MATKRRTIAVLGATGSIGKSALDVIRRNSECFEPILFSAHTDQVGLLALGEEFHSAELALSGRNALKDAPSDGRIHYTGEEGLFQAIAVAGADIVINGIAGSAGLASSLAAIDAGCARLCLANKETVVIAGPLVLEKARANSCQVVPVDSEHSAVFQLLAAHGRDNLDRIILTASGGPFRRFSRDQLARVTPQDALAHPTWNMGAKITIDSATMANKGLEVIEAVRLFDVDADKIEVVVHPQSIVHSMIRFKDGSVYAQMSNPDMRLPIQNALFYPKKAPAAVNSLDFSALTLAFEPPNTELFPLLPLSYQAARMGGLYPAAYNAANEEAVALFLAGKIGFLGINVVVEEVLQKDWTGGLTLESVWDADKRARRAAASAAAQLLMREI
ncbi:MAG: 1-deoxy-D-xylulose-5-phosphate reductoisomerase [Treponema sp.]|jgi:1-deoxy-D-xylulose-5-phosphate reductoisomerase|nr:1-deoxy-D-xylulose-5-phosphate reductoisomerase [Treponema sp.]